MTIENYDRFKESLPDWAMLKGCWGNTRIAPTDIDGCVERNGTCLFLEHKGPGKNGEIVWPKEGQRLTFLTLARQGNTVIVVCTHGGDHTQPGYVRQMMIFRPGGSTDGIQAATLADLRREVAAWFQWASGLKGRE